ncbi:hypothetical protein QWY84_18465 [Aquisalimonas lutea]|uniref:hypothetical protein n=1 Tax=Aquisalimonas lutea TaxID=1327750 RepID=UPI0025B2D79B|nr:hypothetical protein [Aquisalimonas lutea]MDN3519596.1 hypothetical protein [Aquisalimonas lutea]
MHSFDLIDPDNLPVDARLLLRSRPPDMPKYEHFFVVWQAYLLIYAQALHRFPNTGQTEWNYAQSEFPLAIVGWVPWALENKFFKGPREGGIAAGSIHYEDTVQDERVLITRSMKPAGYELANLDRYSHINGRSSQVVQLTDEWLFGDGLLEQFKEWARQYEAGAL